MPRPIPQFAKAAQLCRYVDPDELNGKIVGPGAYMPNPGEDHLSVNSLEVEPQAAIADYYVAALQRGNRPVAISMHTVRRYNELAAKADCSVSYNEQERFWEFSDKGGTAAPAYLHRPVFAKPDFPHASWSHCGVEFVRVISEPQIRHFARRLAAKKAELL